MSKDYTSIQRKNVVRLIYDNSSLLSYMDDIKYMIEHEGKS